MKSLVIFLILVFITRSHAQEFFPMGKNVYMQKDSDCWSFVSRMRPIGPSAGIMYFKEKDKKCEDRPQFIGFIHTSYDVVEKDKSENLTSSMCLKEVQSKKNIQFSFKDDFCFITSKTSSSTTEQIMFAVKEKEIEGSLKVKYYYFSFQVQHKDHQDFLSKREDLLKRIKVNI